MKKVNWQPYLEKIDVILEKKGQPKLTQNESQNIVNNWQARFASPEIHMLLAHAPDMVELILKQDLPNIIHDILKASRGGSYK